MTERIYITGIGIISSIGNNTRETEESLLSEESGINGISLFPTIHKDNLPLAEVRQSNKQLAERCGIKDDRFLTRTK